MSSTIKLADYLFIRLRQLGVSSIHGVPGDFNLTLLDHVEPNGLRWVGNANELNAGYSADAYARVKGLGAVVTTFGVGELSAVNAIAGAYAERAPVVHIVGTPARDLQDGRLLIHHTFNDGEYRRFAQIHSHVTVAQTRLWDPRTSPQQIDEVLRQCIHHSRPIYIEVPVDMVAVPVLEEKLQLPVDNPTAGPPMPRDDVMERILCKIYAAQQPVIFVDGEVRAHRIIDEVQKLVELTKWPTWTTPFGKGLMDETLSNFHGIYRGSFDETSTRSFIGDADLILSFGAHHSATNTYGRSSIPDEKITISFDDTEVRILGEMYRDVPAKYLLSHLIKNIDISKVKVYNPYPELPRDYKLSLTTSSKQDNLSQDLLWHIMANILQPGDIVLGETGTAGYGVREMPLPKHTQLFTPVTWLSIGYMLPGALGAALAQKELIEESNYFGIKKARTILFIGDGSFQMTAQELSTIIHHDLDVLLFVLNNAGYTIERCIHGRNQGYNDVPNWRYLQAPSFLGARGDTYTASVRTWGELAEVLTDQRVQSGKGLRMIELILDREDAPKGILPKYLETQKAKEVNKVALN